MPKWGKTDHFRKLLINKFLNQKLKNQSCIIEENDNIFALKWYKINKNDF